MNKIILNILKIMILLILIQLIITPISEATSLDNILETGDNFLELGKEEEKAEGDKNSLNAKIKFRIEFDGIYNILLTVGIVLSVVIGAILGIQLMWGTIEQQVKVKEMLVPYIAGCIVIFGSFAIWKIFVTILGNV